MAKSNKVGHPMEYDYECDEDLRAIARAEACKADPKRMEKVKALAKKKLDENKARRDVINKEIELGTEAK